ncbi:sulfite oxidase heme-binding subunit YedZ [Coralloluteibacterium stylophorae]|uniref:Protein-methionine-sulfoxide reductase heme-binding subunit MsrQ n=1 Tax=Coralloluteibacterium stylophorae TaxID=1776034 RepID=A0A8J8AX19_9GAMM|nr:protein-methionine-sulfoxide reductase heme-binding subunit MsrQ [Coralloluteibacterium stylophorae]MBS7455801.1 sulfoxide reductase heme-binding subunit YedZ [Coralloluteibacterium stylophorae]
MAARSAAPARPRRRPQPRWIAAKTLVHLLALVPAGVLGWRVLDAFQGGDALGADPVAAITHFTGLWALRMLLVSLAITPLRRLTGWPGWVRFRRMLGLYAFFYASLHFATYLFLDLGGLWAQILEDLTTRSYIIVGFGAWLILLALASTSTTRAIRRLGRRWAQLHRLVYVAAVLAVLHFVWLVKADLREPALYAAILAVLFGIRIWYRLRAAKAAKAAPRRASASQPLKRGA